MFWGLLALLSATESNGPYQKVTHHKRGFIEAYGQSDVHVLRWHTNQNIEDCFEGVLVYVHMQTLAQAQTKHMVWCDYAVSWCMQRCTYKWRLECNRARQRWHLRYKIQHVCLSSQWSTHFCQHTVPLLAPSCRLLHTSRRD
jgi:hypothetical protein